MADKLSGGSTIGGFLAWHAGNSNNTIINWSTADLSVTGNVTVTGTVDGVDIAAEQTRLANTSGTNTGDNVASDFNHDSLSNIPANAHIDWTGDRGATNIHAGNYTDTTYTSNDFTHDSLTGVTANEHLDWTTDRGATNIHLNNVPLSANSNALGGLTSGQFLRSDTNDAMTGVLTVSDRIGIGNGVVPNNNLGTFPSIAIGDADTGFRQNGDGVLEAWANNQEIWQATTANFTVHKPLIATTVTASSAIVSGNVSAGSVSTGTISADKLDLGRPIENFNPHSDFKIHDSIQTNVFAGKGRKLEISVDGVPSSSLAINLTNQHFDGTAYLQGHEFDVPKIINIDMSSNGLYGVNGMTYASGTFIASFYHSPFPSGWSARVRNKDNVWTVMTLTKDGNSLVGTIPIGTYIKDIEFTLESGVTGPYVHTDVVWALTEVSYYANRMGIQQGAYVTAVGGYVGGTLTLDSKLVSDVPTGVAPLQVASTTMVDNLNANTVNGLTVQTSVPAGAIFTDTQSTYTLLPATATVIGGVQGGSDITIDGAGEMSIVDDSHNHIISNVDGLQGALDGKSSTAHSHSYVPAADDRDVKPDTTGVDGVRGIKPFFTSLGGMTGAADTNYQDLLVLDTYADGSGGSTNALSFDKNEKKIRHWLAGQTNTTWGTPEVLAYESWVTANYSVTGHDHDIAYVSKTARQSLHATEAFSISGHTITLSKGDGTVETVVVPDNNTTYVSSNFNHDALTGFVPNEHIDWTVNSAATLHSSNYINTTYVASDFAHDSLSGFVAAEHIDWTVDQGGTNLHANNYTHTHAGTYTEVPVDHTANDIEYSPVWENNAGALYTSTADLKYNPANKRMTTGTFKATTGLELGATSQATMAYNVTDAAIDISTDVIISGSLYASSKSFRIVHPLDNTKTLTYGSLEGPENGVYIRGTLKGDNVITLPDYWKAFVDNDSVTVTLTPRGKPQSLFIKDANSEKVTVGIAGLFKGKGSIECDYAIYAERTDIGKLRVEV